MSFLRHTLNDSHPRSVNNAQEKQIYQNRVTLQTRSQKCNLRHSHSKSHYLTGPHSLSPTPLDTIPVLKSSLSRIPIPAVAPSQTQVTFSEKIASRTTPKIDTQARSSITDLLGLPHGNFYLCTHIIPLYCASRSSPPSSKPCRDFLRTKSWEPHPRWVPTGSPAPTTRHLALKSAHSLRLRPLGAPPRLRTQCVLSELPTTPARGPLGPGAVNWPELSRPLFP